jgi:hypothetical protein
VEAIDRAVLDASFVRAASWLDELTATLEPGPRLVLAHLLASTSRHPLIGEGVDPSAVAEADAHVASHVQPARRAAREVAARIATRVTPRTALRHVPSDDDAQHLAQSLRELILSAPRLEAGHLRELISNALGGLSPDDVRGGDAWRRATWTAAVGALTGDVAEPVARRPSFVSDDLLERWRREAAMQSFLAVRMGPRAVAPGGPEATRAGASMELHEAVCAAAGRDLVVGNGFQAENATYLYYEQPDDWVQPHVDPFGITNALVLLEHHVGATGGRSQLVVLDPRHGPRPVPFMVGDMVVLDRGEVVHAREPVDVDERITLLSFVFAEMSFAPLATHDR